MPDDRRARNGALPGSPQRDPGLEAAEGTAADRDTTIEHLITAIWFLAIGALSLAAYAPRRRTIELRAVANSLAEVAACLTQAIQAPADDTEPGHNAAPARHQDGRQ